MIHLLLLVAVLVAPPELLVNWASTHAFDAITIVAQGTDTLSQECIKNGLEVRYRYEMRICRVSSYWMDSCQKASREVHTLQYDPILQTYRLSNDRLEDTTPPTITNEALESEAIQNLSTIKYLPIDALRTEEAGENKKEYVSVRLLTQCRGVYSQTLERIGYFLSLGLLRSSGFDSGWVSFPLTH